MAMIRTQDGRLVKCSGRSVLPLEVWHHVVMTVNSEQLLLFENGEQTGMRACQQMASGSRSTIWFGTNAAVHAGRADEVEPAAASGAAAEFDSESDNLPEATLWDGRIDELSLFDRSLSEEAIVELYERSLNQASEPDGQPMEKL